MAVTKANVNKLNKELQDTVKSIFEKYGMMITASQIRYNDATAEFKITAKTLGEDGVQVIDPTEQAKSNWYVYTQGIGTPDNNKYKDILGKTIELTGFGTGKVISFNTRSKKYTVLSDDNKRYLMSWETLKQADGLLD